MKGRTPQRIGEVGCQRVQRGDAGLDDRTGAIGTGVEGRDQGRSGRAQAAARCGEDRVALGMLEPQQPLRIGVARVEIAHPGREVVASGERRRAIGQHQHRANLAWPARTLARCDDRQLHQVIDVQNRLASSGEGAIIARFWPATGAGNLRSHPT